MDYLTHLMTSNTVFISYAREDARYAERLYMDLRIAGVDAWLDTKRLLPGQNWKLEIQRVIRESAYFIALISENSLNKRGFVQSEMKRALDVLDEIPSSQIFLIQARLDNSSPYDEQLQSINWVDLFPSYEKGFERILATLRNLDKVPLEMRDPVSLTGSRAPIHYTPYRSFTDFMKDLIERLPKSASLADRDYAMYIRYATATDGVILPSEMKEKYPTEITIVLQNQFENLTAFNNEFTVVLWFSGAPSTLQIPYDAIKEVVVPTIGLRIEYFGLKSDTVIFPKSSSTAQ